VSVTGRARMWFAEWLIRRLDKHRYWRQVISPREVTTPEISVEALLNRHYDGKPVVRLSVRADRAELSADFRPDHARDFANSLTAAADIAGFMRPEVAWDDSVETQP
jgi:hypothetical protein